MPGPSGRPLKILHVMRAPVGGLFRHLVGLVRGQAAPGPHVGILADSTTGGPRADETLASIAPDLALGLHRRPMSRHLGWRDVGAWRDAARRGGEGAADVVHGHGAKGSAFARLTDARAGARAIRVYTPHGGSLHFDWGSPIGFAYLSLERALLRRTELILFDSAFARDVFAAKIGPPSALARVVHNGVAGAEFQPVTPDDAATDLVFVGELRSVKGVDVLIEAIGILASAGRPVTATIVGAGPEAAALAAQARQLVLAGAVRFPGPMPARDAFALGRLLVVPSRFESLPYIVLEAAAAGLPLITTAVGGIAEIFGPLSQNLVAPGDAAVLARSIAAAPDEPAAGRAAAAVLRARVPAPCSLDAMTDAVLAAYREALERRE